MHVNKAFQPLTISPYFLQPLSLPSFPKGAAIVAPAGLSGNSPQKPRGLERLGIGLAAVTRRVGRVSRAALALLLNLECFGCLVVCDLNLVLDDVIRGDRGGAMFAVRSRVGVQGAFLLVDLDVELVAQDHTDGYAECGGLECRASLGGRDRGVAAVARVRRGVRGRGGSIGGRHRRSISRLR